MPGIAVPLVIAPDPWETLTVAIIVKLVVAPWPVVMIVEFGSFVSVTEAIVPVVNEPMSTVVLKGVGEGVGEITVQYSFKQLLKNELRLLRFGQ